MTLLERIEAATEGSRELDELVWEFCGGQTDKVLYDNTDHPVTSLRWFWEKKPMAISSTLVTTSIDAALALVERVRPQEKNPLLGPSSYNGKEEGKYWVVILDVGHSAIHVSLPLAICIALVKAEAER